MGAEKLAEWRPRLFPPGVKDGTHILQVMAKAGVASDKHLFFMQITVLSVE